MLLQRTNFRKAKETTQVAKMAEVRAGIIGQTRHFRDPNAT